MKKYLFLLLMLLPSITFAGVDYWFSNLDDKCTSSSDGTYASNIDKLLLPHINARITKSEWYVKHDNHLYILANTFTDNYAFLWSYLMQYNCGNRSIKYLTSLLKKSSNSWTLWFLSFDKSVAAFKIDHIGFGNYHNTWIYDLSGKIKYINSIKIKWTNGKKIAWTARLSSYTGRYIEIEKRYYVESRKFPTDSLTYIYDNLNNPDLFQYKF